MISRAPVTRLLLLASPDDYLLDLERRDAETAWSAAHPDGEVTTLDEAPSAAVLVRELASPSLFAPTRLFVVRDAGAYLKPGAAGADGELLARALGELSLSDVALILAVVCADEPGGALGDVVRERGELRFLPLPPPPKPWDRPGITPPQRLILEGIVRRVAPELIAQHDVLDALFESYGFRPRELAQAAERLRLAGELTPDAVRIQAGPGECTLKDLEDVLLRRDERAAAGFFARLSAGGPLVGWWGDEVSSEKLGRTLASTLSRSLRQALAIRCHAVQAGLEAELDPAECAGQWWYPSKFKKSILPRLTTDVEGAPGSPLAGLSAWNLHRAFRLAAAYGTDELLDALARLGATGAEVVRPPAAALAALTSVVLNLIGTRRDNRHASAAARPARPRVSRQR